MTAATGWGSWVDPRSYLPTIKSYLPWSASTDSAALPPAPSVTRSAPPSSIDASGLASRVVLPAAASHHSFPRPTPLPQTSDFRNISVTPVPASTLRAPLLPISKTSGLSPAPISTMQKPFPFDIRNIPVTPAPASTLKTPLLSTIKVSGLPQASVSYGSMGSTDFFGIANQSPVQSSYPSLEPLAPSSSFVFPNAASSRPPIVLAPMTNDDWESIYETQFSDAERLIAEYWEKGVSEIANDKKAIAKLKEKRREISVGTGSFPSQRRDAIIHSMDKFLNHSEYYSCCFPNGCCCLSGAASIATGGGLLSMVSTPLTTAGWVGVGLGAPLLSCGTMCLLYPVIDKLFPNGCPGGVSIRPLHHPSWHSHTAFDPQNNLPGMHIGNNTTYSSFGYS